MSQATGPIAWTRIAMLRVSVACGVGAILCASSNASPPARSHLGATLEVVSRGPSSTVDIKLRPTVAFASVTVEAASGVASVGPACAFDAVVVGGSYTCRMTVTGTLSDPSLTINVVGQRVTAPEALRYVEVSSLTMTNPSFVQTKKPVLAKPQTMLLSSPDGANTQ